MELRARYLLLAALLALTATPPACATSGGEASSESAEAEAAESSNQPPRRTGLDATLWTQSSAERAATTRQAYAVARMQLDRALDRPDWTAALEQKEMGDYDEKPPAVVVDVDETVLDNSAYQARLLRDGESFDTETWNAWCREAKAPPVPGALQFAEYAAERDVTIFYVTNREHAVEEATRKNLKEAGFPLPDDEDAILTKNERDDWGSDKTPRRRTIAEDYRILLLVGDNLGDFVGDTEGTPDERAELVRRHESRWGKHWIALANPMYGDWESATFDHDWSLPANEQHQHKMDALETRDTQ